MTTISDIDYVLATSERDTEFRRLGLLERAYDARTVEHFERTGIGPGWRCLELGPGRGSAVRWLAGRVGQTGRVDAVDLDPRFLDDVPTNVRVRRADVRTDDLGPGGYDLVHCRALLMHLPDPVDVLRRMYDQLAPGGWLVVEEGDWGLAGVAGVPGAESVNALLRRSLDAFDRRGILTSYFGRELPALVARLGVEGFGADTVTPIGSAGDLHVEWFRQSWHGVRHAFLSVGVTTDELESAAAVLADPALIVSSMTLVSACGRRPANAVRQ